MNLFINIGHG